MEDSPPAKVAKLDAEAGVVQPEAGVVQPEPNGTNEQKTIKEDGVNTSLAGSDAKDESTPVVSKNPNSETTNQEGQDNDESSLLCEKDVGIVEYINHNEGFTGVLKQRYADFLVNEVDEAGNIVRLTDLSVGEATRNSTEAETDHSSFLTEEDRTQLKALVESKDKSQEYFIKVGDSKEHRTNVHQAIKSFKGLTSSTVDKDGEKMIKIAYVGHKDNSRGQGNRRAKKGEDYCYFVMQKENIGTMEAVNLFSKYLRCKPGQFSYAGTKDKRGITCQKICAHRLSIESIHGLNKCLRGIKLGNFKYGKTCLRLGDLKGNHFTIVLRNITGDTDCIKESVESLQMNGFINYFGLQRFGTTSVYTHDVGRALIKGNWPEAIDLILKPRHGTWTHEHKNIADARKVWQETKDPKQALSAIGGKYCIERHLLVGLTKNNKSDYVSALSTIPRSTRQMYLHAYQSYVWNCLVTRRIKELGLKPIVGDLVLEDKDAIEDGNDQEPVVLTEDSVDKYTIADVILPVPGCAVVYPENQVKMWYDEMLKKDDIEYSMFKNKIRDYNLPGAYRKIIAKPSNFKYSFKKYNDYTIPLVLNDYQILTEEKMSEENADDPHTALVLEMTLPSSTYATMALREILKCDTSPSNMRSLNVT